LTSVVPLPADCLAVAAAGRDQNRGSAGIVLKKIECYIQPLKLEPLTEALVARGVDGMSVTRIRGFGRQHGHISEPDAAEAEVQAGHGVQFRDKLKLEIVVPESRVTEVVRLIVKLARTGSVGAGKVFVVPVEDAVRIGTGEVGYTAVV